MQVDYTMIIINVLKLVFGVIFTISAVVGLLNMYKIVQLYHKRQVKLIEFYALLVSKKNEFDYVSSPAYKEERLRKLYGAYKSGEKMVIFTGDVRVGTPSYKDRDINPAEIWELLLTKGVDGLFTQQEK